MEKGASWHGGEAEEQRSKEAEILPADDAQENGFVPQSFLASTHLLATIPCSALRRDAMRMDPIRSKAELI